MCLVGGMIGMALPALQFQFRQFITGWSAPVAERALNGPADMTPVKVAGHGQSCRPHDNLSNRIVAHRRSR